MCNDISKVINQVNDRLLRDLWGEPGTVTNSTIAPLTETDLNWKSLEDAIELIKPKLYYVSSDYAERDCILEVYKNKTSPRFIMFHTDNKEKYLEQLRDEYRVIPLSEYKG